MGGSPGSVAAPLVAGRRRLLQPPRALSRNRPKRAALAGVRSPEPGPGPGQNGRLRAPLDVQDNERRALTSASAAASTPGSLPSGHGAGESGGARERRGFCPSFPS